MFLVSRLAGDIMGKISSERIGKALLLLIGFGLTVHFTIYAGLVGLAVGVACGSLIYYLGRKDWRDE